jgi:uncharacterized membrane protein YfcA
MLAFSLVPGSAYAGWTFFLLGATSAAIAGMGKAGFGSGIGAAAVPIMVLACGDAKLALGMVLPLLIACDYVSVIYWWRKWDLRNLRFLVPGALVGIGIGSLVLWWLLTLGGVEGAQRKTTNAALSLIIGGVCMAFIGMQAIRALRGRLVAFRPLLWQGLLVGAAAGLTSTLSHGAGPITGMYLLPQQLPKKRFVATTNLYYWIGNQAKLPTYLILGLLTPEVLIYGLLFLPAVVAGALLGVFLHHRVNERWFSIAIHALLTVVGINLIVGAVRALWH